MYLLLITDIITTGGGDIKQVFDQLRCQFYPKELSAQTLSSKEHSSGNKMVHPHSLTRKLLNDFTDYCCDLCKEDIYDNMIYDCNECNWSCHLECVISATSATATNIDIERKMEEKIFEMKKDFIDKLNEIKILITNNNSSSSSNNNKNNDNNNRMLGR